MSFPTRVPSFAGRSSLALTAMAVSVLLAACDDSTLPVQPADEILTASNVAPATVRTNKGDLVTGDAAAFADALKQIGPDGQVLVWLKETNTPRPSAEFLINLPGSAAETIALATEAPGVQRRNTLGPASVRGASVDAVARALSRAGVVSVERMDALPLMVVKLPENVRVGALNALLRHPNVDYVSAVRTRTVELTAAPLGANVIDAKHTLHRIPEVWDLTRGSGAKVGILDSGLARSAATGAYHDDGLYFGSYGILPLGFIDDYCGSAGSGGCTAWDDEWRDGSYPHGTAMAGLVGQNDNDAGYVGIAPHATTYSMKIFWNTYIHGHCGFWPGDDSGGCLEEDDFIRAVNYAASHRLHVLSMSFIGSFGGDVYRALATARNSYGVFLVAATGNTVGASAKEPASYDVVMGIAGVDVAGNNMYSTAARDVSGYAGGATLGATCYKYSYCDAGSPGQQSSTGGTSAATANIAGVVGLIRSYHPYESVSQVWERLVNTAEGPNRVVNAYAAITYQRPLSASISGPLYVGAYEYGTWSAVAMNGTAPYTYAWYRDGAYVGSGATYSDYSYGNDFQLQVYVTDAAGATAGAWLYVTGNAGGGGDCPNCQIP
ncbi:MAG TPA: S8 family serine peptidase [Longimicrobium sp.]